MKRAVVIVRFGVPNATVGDIYAMGKLTDGEMNAMGQPFPGGIASVIYTDLGIDEIRNVFTVAEQDTNDILPVLIFNWGSQDIMIDFKSEEVEDMFNEIPEFCEAQKEVIVLTLDDILDKISRTGVESLEQEELALLKSFAKGGK